MPADPVELVAKHVHGDRQVARDILDDLAYDSLHALLAARTDRIREQAAEIKGLRRQLQSVDIDMEG